MRRLVALMGALAGILGLCLYRQGCYIPGEGERIDYYGSETTALECCDELWREYLDGVTVIYAYTPLRAYYKRVHGEKVNVMIAVRGNKISVGSPILKGSY